MIFLKFEKGCNNLLLGENIVIELVHCEFQEFLHIKNLCDCFFHCDFKVNYTKVTNLDTLLKA